MIKAKSLKKTDSSVGGGFIATARQLSVSAREELVSDPHHRSFPFGSADELLKICSREAIVIDPVALSNEDVLRLRASGTPSILRPLWRVHRASLMRRSGLLCREKP